MRWSIIRLIWLRELRDQLRDRRTLFMIAGLPLLLYPVLGICVLTFALQFFEKPSRIGIAKPNGDRLEFPYRDMPTEPATAASIVGYSSLPGISAATSSVTAIAYLDDPPLVLDDEFTPPAARGARGPLPLSPRLKVVWFDGDPKDGLDNQQVDLILRASPDFYADLHRAEMGLETTPQPRGSAESFPRGRAMVRAEMRPDDDRGRQALNRLRPVLDSWKGELKKVRFVRRGLHASFDNPFEVEEPRTTQEEATLRLVEMVIRVFPFMLVMWSLAGALYPAVDLCAGEKERGTMETLLITPAGRGEIVVGKFLTIWVFSALSGLLNLAGMGICTSQFGAVLPSGSLSLAALFWCILLSLPLSALFSAVCLAIGAYARSSKEGQYYLMPLFLVTMPLIFLTLAPGVELSPFYSLVPVTGVALLMQKLMTSQSLAAVPWLYFVPVLAPIALYSALALRWAIDQFQREDVLFREAERLDLTLWLRHLFRDKEATATSGQAFFLFALLMSLAWLGLGVGRSYTLIVRSTVGLLAFVLTPTLLMAIMLNHDPLETLRLRWPKLKELALAAALALLLLPPLVWTGREMLRDFPQMQQLLEEPLPFIQQIRSLTTTAGLTELLAFALLPAIAEELTFRGLILTGLKKRYRPRTAVLLAAFLNALYHMNVFTFLPIFGLSVMLGLLTLRSRSVLPAMLFHLLSKSILVLSLPLGTWIDEHLSASVLELWPWFVAICFVTAVSMAWILYRKPYWDIDGARW
jgi:sodium transport system permease protein